MFAAEVAYTRSLLRIWKKAQRTIMWGLEPLLAVWQGETLDSVGVRTDIGPEDRPAPARVTPGAIEEQIAFITRYLSAQIGVELGEAFALNIARRIDLGVKGELESVLGVNLRRTVPGLSTVINQWREANIALIESGVMARFEPTQLRPSLLADVSKTIESAHVEGVPIKELTGKLRERFEVSNSRARLIARDQVGKLNGQINKHRQEAAGVREYKWSTANDERVRPDHADRDNVTFQWAAPPDDGHPGHAIQCRCVAVPIIPDFLAE